MRTFVLSIITASVLCACGGGGSASNNPSATSTISGTAAGGAPMVGTVVIKHAQGETSPVTIQADGSYSVDVSGLTGPFIVKAIGTVGGQKAVYYSVATSADVGATVNVTPLSSLITGNLAGGLPEELYASGNTSVINRDAISTAVTNVQTQLAPVMESLGVGSTFDPLHSRFTANGQGFDAALDVVKVSFDPDTPTQAIVRNVVTGDTATKDLTSSATPTPISAPASNMADAVSDLQAIRQVLNTLTTQLRSGIPADTTAIRALYTSDYMEHGDTDPIAVIRGEGSDADVAGVTFRDPVIVKKVSATQWLLNAAIIIPNEPVYNWFTIMKKVDANGQESASGSWKIAGDQRYFEVSMYPAGFHNADALQTTSQEVIDFANVPSNVREIRIRGAGLYANYSYNGAPLSDDILVFRRAANDSSGPFSLVSATGALLNSGGWLERCEYRNAPTLCVQSSDLLVGNTYTVTALDANGNQLRQFNTPLLQRMLAADLSNRERRAAYFASDVTANKSLAEMHSGTAVTVSWTLPSVLNRPADIQSVTLEIVDDQGHVHAAGRRDNVDGPFTAANATLTIPDLGDATIASARAVVILHGEGQAIFVTKKAID
jgi:hypothetical protein